LQKIFDKASSITKNNAMEKIDEIMKLERFFA
jgi:hypothetical protein